MLITEFYKNKELFITGGTGYLGKSFIEKLLRSCPDVSKVYLLIREKKNKTASDRLKELSNDLVFERLHREQPKAFEKVVPITGDTCQLGLGISSEDLQRLKNVHIIVHGAANVRFDTNLSTSILMNTRGTYELLKLAVNLKHLLAFIHVSTAYVSPFQSYVPEQMCEAPVYWRTAIKIAETVDDESLESLKIKYSQFPNAYSFTKNLSEQVVAEFADKLPVTILRPSIVSQSYEEPEPGYIDNLNGPMAACVAIAMGLAQVTYCNRDLVMSLIPVDTISILTVIAVYRRGLETINSKKNGLDIRNLTLGKLHDTTLYGCAIALLHNVEEEPFEKSLWAPSPIMTTNFYLFMLCIFFVNIPMALVYDTLLMLTKKERMVMQLTRKFVFSLKAFGKFSKEYFDFQNDGMMELIKIVPEEEKDKFSVEYIFGKIDMHKVTKDVQSGIKKYILNEPQKATPATKRRYKILIIVDKLVKLLVFLGVLIMLWKMSF